MRTFQALLTFDVVDDNLSDVAIGEEIKNDTVLGIKSMRHAYPPMSDHHCIDIHVGVPKQLMKAPHDVTCPFCKHKDILTDGDENTSTFYYCHLCGNKWEYKK